MKNVPALKKENYTTTMNNHVAKIEFQLSAVRYPEEPVEIIMRTWEKTAEELLQDEDFGAVLTKANNYFDDEVKKAIAGAATPVQKAKKCMNMCVTILPVLITANGCCLSL